MPRRDRHGQARITHAEHRRIAQERPQRRRGIGDRNARPPPSCPFVNEVAVDVARPQGGQLLIGLLAPLKEYLRVSVPPLNRLSAQSSFVAHPSGVLVELTLKPELDNGSAPPAQKLQPRARDVDQSLRGRRSVADGLPLARNALEILHIDACGYARSQMSSEPQQLFGLHT